MREICGREDGHGIKILGSELNNDPICELNRDPILRWSGACFRKWTDVTGKTEQCWFMAFLVHG